MIPLPLALNYDEYGSSDAKQTLVILHGLYGSKSNWRSYGKKLSDKRRVIIPDLRNHGRSPRSDDMSYHAQVADLSHLLQALQVKHAIILGHSMGGKVALCHALRHDEQGHGYIIADIAPLDYRWHVANHRNIIGALSSVDTAQNRNIAFKCLRESGLSEKICRFLLLSYVPRNNGSYEWLFNLKALEQNVEVITGFPTERKGSYKSTVHFMAGERSEYLVPHIEETKSIFPKARFKIIPESGHWLHAEQPHAFTACLESILGDEFGIP